MTVITHCLPTGALAAGEIPVSNVGDGTVQTYLPSSPKRGVIVGMHGLQVNFLPVPPAVVATNATTAGFEDFTFQFINSLVADGWVYVAVPYPDDFYSGSSGGLAFYNSVAADPTFGSLYLNHTTLLWWDHIVDYIHTKYAINIPIISYGASWGGWHCLQITANRASTIAGYIAHVPACIAQNISPIFTSPLNMYTNNCSGCEVGPTALNAVTTPGIIGYGTSDEVVGWAATTFAGTTGTNVNTFTGTQTLSVASSANLIGGASLKVTTSNGYAIMTFTGTATGAVTNCKTVFGTGTIASGAPVVQNNTDALITNQQAAQPTQQVTRYSAAETHDLSSADATTYSNWIAKVLDPLCPAIF
jgi:hypothetical protein